MLKKMVFFYAAILGFIVFLEANQRNVIETLHLLTFCNELTSNHIKIQISNLRTVIFFEYAGWLSKWNR